jgi:hypothetical protein
LAAPRIKQTPPKLTPLVGRKSPAGSQNFGGLGKGIDMPDQSQQPQYKHAIPQVHSDRIFGANPMDPLK